MESKTKAKTAKNPAGRGAKKTILSTEFTLQAPDAKEIFLVGSFNDWAIGDGFKLRKNKGVWRKVVKLQPGRYEYQFVVDGNWWTDPGNSERVGNIYGTENSVITVA